MSQAPVQEQIQSIQFAFLPVVPPYGRFLPAVLVLNADPCFIPIFNDTSLYLCKEGTGLLACPEALAHGQAFEHRLKPLGAHLIAREHQRNQHSQQRAYNPEGQCERICIDARQHMGDLCIEKRERIVA